METLVSVVIPTYNRENFICKCIQAVVDSSYENLEIIVVNNCSTDNTLSEINSKINDSRVTVINNDENLMCAGARNIGIRNAKGKYILLMDDDNIIDRDAIQYMIDDMEEDSSIGIVTALCIQIDDPSVQVVSSYVSLYTSKLHHREGEYRFVQKKYSTQCCENMCMIRKAVVDDVGYIDESYYIMLEDTDYSQRIIRSGYKAIVDTRAKTIHHRVRENTEISELRDLGIANPQRAFYFARNRTVYIRKFAPFFGKVCYFIIFMQLFLGYYSFIMLKNKRVDIFLAYCKGYIKGCTTTIDRNSYIPCRHM